MEDEFWSEDESWFEEGIENSTVCPVCGGSGLEDDEDVCFMCFGRGFIES